MLLFFQLTPDSVYLQEDFGDRTEVALRNGQFDLESFQDGKTFLVIGHDQSTHAFRPISQHPAQPSVPSAHLPFNNAGTSAGQTTLATANRFSKKQPLIIAIAVRADLDEKGRPTNVHRHNTSVHVNIYNEDEANVTFVTDKVRDELDEIILVDAKEITIRDQEGTSGKELFFLYKKPVI